MLPNHHLASDECDRSCAGGTAGQLLVGNISASTLLTPSFSGLYSKIVEFACEGGLLISVRGFSGDYSWTSVFSKRYSTHTAHEDGLLVGLLICGRPVYLVQIQDTSYGKGFVALFWDYVLYRIGMAIGSVAT
jgi:hypothetical protein